MSVIVHHPAILIIAAGQSKRLGTPKQLLEFAGDSLINRLIKITKQVKKVPVTLVLGSNNAAIKEQLKDDSIQIVDNDSWEEGMASSIRVGVVSILQKDAIIDGILILVCDQPHLDANLIQSMLDLQKESCKSMVACSYKGIVGTPVLFHQKLFNQLIALEGETGAKKIIKDNPDDLAILPFEKGIVDIDTMEDYQNLVKENKQND